MEDRMTTPNGPQDPQGSWGEPNPYGQPSDSGQVPGYPGSPQPPAYGQQPGYPAYGQGGYNAQPQGTPPPNYLVWAIISILLCTIPGIVAIVYSTQVNSKWATGDSAGAYNASKSAKTWSLVATIAGGLFLVIYIGLIVTGVVAGSTVDTYNNY
jgi:hypothetical protein